MVPTISLTDSSQTFVKRAAQTDFVLQLAMRLFGLFEEFDHFAGPGLGGGRRGEGPPTGLGQKAHRERQAGGREQTLERRMRREEKGEERRREKN